MRRPNPPASSGWRYYISDSIQSQNAAPRRLVAPEVRRYILDEAAASAGSNNMEWLGISRGAANFEIWTSPVSFLRYTAYRTNAKLITSIRESSRRIRRSCRGIFIWRPSKFKHIGQVFLTTGSPSATRGRDRLLRLNLGGRSPYSPVSRPPFARATSECETRGS